MEMCVGVGLASGQMGVRDVETIHSTNVVVVGALLSFKRHLSGIGIVVIMEVGFEFLMFFSFV